MKLIKRIKGAYLFVTSLVLGLFSFPFAYAKTIEKRSKKLVHSVVDTTGYLASLKPSLVSLYDSLQMGITGVNKAAFELAQKGFDKLKEQGYFVKDSIISIIDFSLPSSAKRLFVINMNNNEILYNTYVAHGRNSGKEFASSFSNTPSSLKSSLGFYVTGDTYVGEHGLSLKLDGIERGFNDNARRRAVVIHPAAYVNESLINSQGYIGRSFGCPAIPPKESKQIINTIKDGTCLFIYSPDKRYLENSAVLNHA